MTEYEIVADEERPRSVAAQAGADLIEGKTLWFPGASAVPLHNRLRYYTRRAGWKIHTHSHTRDGVQGVIAWAEKK